MGGTGYPAVMAVRTVKTRVEPATDLIMLLSQASHALETEMAAGLGELGLSPREFCVLSKARAGELTQIRLAELCDLDKTTMVVTVDALEAAGLAERQRSATDRRARIIAVTPAGDRLVDEAQLIVNGIYDDVLAALPATERRALVHALERLLGGRLALPLPHEASARRRTARTP